jgi:hypothetical protein
MLSSRYAVDVDAARLVRNIIRPVGMFWRESKDGHNAAIAG